MFLRLVSGVNRERIKKKRERVCVCEREREIWGREKERKNISGTSNDNSLGGGDSGER